jgi:hypothetical protein
MNILSKFQKCASSFRDPSGFVFWKDGALYRQINISYRTDYDSLRDSGLYTKLIDEGLLIPHREVTTEFPATENIYKVIQPELIPFISYPYEWCFGQLKSAALTTLNIQKKAMSCGLTLKDASSYNIQFHHGRPVLIDTLSFEKNKEGTPWIAYRQFCQHFLAPLALMSRKDIRLNQLLRVYLDGIPLDLTSELLPFSTKLNFPLLLHIHLHAKSQKIFANRGSLSNKKRTGENSLLGLIDSLESAVTSLTWNPGKSEWSDYYDETNYSSEAFMEKKEIVSSYLTKAGSKDLWDLGANTGVFSRIASSMGIQTVSFDIDSAAVERNYIRCQRDNESCILPLQLDITNPSPGIGWENLERMTLAERGPVDAILALALIHHLAIANNIPLDSIAEYFSKLCHTLIIEFVPKEDSQAQRLLQSREDIFDKYDQSNFELIFSEFFTIVKTDKIKNTKRVMYLMNKKKL